jgi:hypothetical protein
MCGRSIARAPLLSRLVVGGAAMRIFATALDRSRLRLAVIACALWVVTPVVEAATVQDTSNDAILVYDNAFTTVTTFVRTNDHIDLALSTSTTPDALPDDVIGLQVLNVAGSSITLAETITNGGPYPWHEWVEEAFGVPFFSEVPTWGSYSSSVAGTFDPPEDLLGLGWGLVFRFDSPLLPGESFTLQKTLTYAGLTGDLDAGVQVLSFGAALPVPPAVWLLGSALLGLFGLMRRKSVTA